MCHICFLNILDEHEQFCSPIVHLERHILRDLGVVFQILRQVPNEKLGELHPTIEMALELGSVADQEPGPIDPLRPSPPNPFSKRI